MYRPVQNPQNQMTASNGQPSVRMALFSPRNNEVLINTLRIELQNVTGQPLNDTQTKRLEKAIQHYTKEVYDVQGEKPLSILNREIIRITSDDFSKYFQRQEVVRTQPMNPVQTIANDTLFQDTSTRFERLQQERQEVKALPPPMPDFRISLNEEGPTSADLFEKAKRQREQEALRQANSNRDALDRIDPGLQKRITADDSFRNMQKSNNRATDIAVIERQSAPKSLDMPLIVPPDRRELMLSTNVTIDPTGTPRDLGQANSNPTTTYPLFSSPQKSNLQQDYIIRQENVVSYKEIENNLFVYSADRNWLQNIKENRYNFSVVFDPGHTTNRIGPNIEVQEKFKNITRIELVKAILPVEGLNTLIYVGPDISENTNFQANVLSMPFVSVNIEELDSNNYGSQNAIDRSFAVIQYDANWYGDVNTYRDSRGFTAMIPKFLKCQKVYEPTPLSTLQKLTISLLRPNGTPLSVTSDVFDIVNILGAGPPGPSQWTSGSLYNVTDVDGNPKYYFIQCSTFFSRFQFSLGDNIRIANFSYTNTCLEDVPSLRYFSNWINNTNGFLLAGIGYRVDNSVVDGPNEAGYANVLIIDARYMDPTTGSTAIDPFGPTINSDLVIYENCLLTPRRLINLSRQVQLTFRVITRELDPVGQLRPDNL
jgi:hypothetical protein